MAGLLTDHLIATARRGFAYGELDCGLFLADWILRRRGFDPAAELRGRYARLEEVPGIAGGLLRILTGLALAHGLAVTRYPEIGDVALIRLCGRPAVGAIRGPRGWLVLSEGGGISCARNVRIVRAWRV